MIKKSLLAMIIGSVSLMGTASSDSSYPVCGSGFLEGLCADSELDSRGHIEWAGLRRNKSKYYGFQVLHDGHVYIGPDKGAPQSPGQLINVISKKIIDVQVDKNGAMTKFVPGSVEEKNISEKKSCKARNSDSNERCFSN